MSHRLRIVPTRRRPPAGWSDDTRELGITVAAVRYRLGPDHPAPAAVEDAYAALRGLAERASDLHIDIDRIAIGGASAGGGIAAALALLAHDRAEIRPVFQLLLYPMLDDRTTTRGDLDTLKVRVWTPRATGTAGRPTSAAPSRARASPPYAAAARREDLTGLPPAWIGVGTLDLFHDEDVEYAHRLSDSGVPCDLDVIPGAFTASTSCFPRPRSRGSSGADKHGHSRAHCETGPRPPSRTRPHRQSPPSTPSPGSRPPHRPTAVAAGPPVLWPEPHFAAVHTVQ